MGRESEPSPVPQGSAPQAFAADETGCTPLFPGGSFLHKGVVRDLWLGCQPGIGPLLQNANPDLNFKVQLILECLGGLESRANHLDVRLGTSFRALCTELDEVWSEFEMVNGASANRGFGVESFLLFQGQESTPTPSSPVVLSHAAFQQLMRQVVDNLMSMGIENLQEGADGVNIPCLSGCVDTLEDSLSGIFRQVGLCKNEIHRPDGAIGRFKSTIKALKDKDRHPGDTINQGGKTFRDVLAVTAWVHTFKNKDLYC